MKSLLYRLQFFCAVPLEKFSNGFWYKSSYSTCEKEQAEMDTVQSFESGDNIFLKSDNKSMMTYHKRNTKR